MDSSLEDLLVSLGLTPRMPGAGGAPVQNRYTPFDTSQMPGQGGMGAPAGVMNNAGVTPATPALPAKLQMALDQEAQTGQVGGAPPAGSAPVNAGTMPTGGFAPPPRPPLPPALTQGAEFGAFRDNYTQGAQAVDPIAALLGTSPNGPGFTPPPPPSRALAPPWSAAGGQVPGVGEGPLTESEKTLLRQSPAYARAINKHRMLDRLRVRRGMM